MGTIIEEFSRPFKAGRNAAYPWAHWSDGSIWRIERGTDFSGKPTGMRAQLYRYAGAHGLSCRCLLLGDALEFQFFRRST